SLKIDGSTLPSIADDDASLKATRKLVATLDQGAAALIDDGNPHSTPSENASVEGYLASLYSDATYQKLFPQSFGIGMTFGQGRVVATGDAVTTYHAEQILNQFKPSVMVVSLFDVDTCHTDYNGYLLNQQIADACVAHLWDYIQSTPGLANET